MDVTLRQTHNRELIRSIITHPSIYRHMVSDGACPPEEFQPHIDDKVRYVLAFDGDELMGMFILVPQTNICCEVHAMFLPNAYGLAIEAYRKGIEWVWAHTQYRRMIGFTPVNNRLAVRIAERAGLQRIGLNERSIRKDGKVFDQIIFGIGVN